MDENRNSLLMDAIREVAARVATLKDRLEPVLSVQMAVQGTTPPQDNDTENVSALGELSEIQDSLMDALDRLVV